MTGCTSNQKRFYSRGIQTLAKRWKNVLNELGIMLKNNAVVITVLINILFLEILRLFIDSSLKYVITWRYSPT
jgi:hypothetical protein